MIWNCVLNQYYIGFYSTLTIHCNPENYIETQDVFCSALRDYQVV